MNRTIVYSGALPQGTDILQPQRDALMTLGLILQDLLGAGTYVSGMSCGPGSGLNVVVQPGQIYAPMPVDSAAFGALGSDSHAIVKQGPLLDPLTLATPAPTVAGHSINYLIQVKYLEVDTDPVVLPYFNYSDPLTPFNGPGGSGQAQNTLRKATCDVKITAGASAPTGTQQTPVASKPYDPLYVVTVSHGETGVDPAKIVRHPEAPSTVAKAILTQLLAVDGSGSGLDADTVRGLSPTQVYPGWQGCAAWQNSGHERYITQGSNNFPITWGATGASTYAAQVDSIGAFSAASPTRLTVPAGVTRVKVSTRFGIASIGAGRLMSQLRHYRAGAVINAWNSDIVGKDDSQNIDVSLGTSVMAVQPGDYFIVVATLYAPAPAGNYTLYAGSFFQMEVAI